MQFKSFLPIVILSVTRLLDLFGDKFHIKFVIDKTDDSSGTELDAGDVKIPLAKCSDNTDGSRCSCQDCQESFKMKCAT